MADCCTQTPPKKHRCPVNGKQYHSVSAKTILHNIKSPWNLQNSNQGYYFCDDPECDVVYFGLDDSTIKQTELRKVVGVKENKPHSMVCYCFGVSRQESADQSIKEFVIKQTRDKTCACTTRNPSGRCCLKDFH